MSIARHHAEWLALLDISGSFLSLKTLAGAFPQGLDAPDADVTRELRLAYEEWRDATGGTRPDLALHRAWVEWVLRRVLELPDDAIRGQRIGVRVQEENADPFWQSLLVQVPEHGETLRPDLVVGEPHHEPNADPRPLNPRILVQIVPPGQDLEKAPAKAIWQASPATRMMTLLRGAGVRLGLLTNGEQWMLVDRPADENSTTGFASWYARLWLDEPLTLRAFRSLLGAHRLFGVPEQQSLEALLTASAEDRQEVTDQLGYQVRRAVELLVQAIDLADQDAGRSLLRSIPPERLYEASLAVMMRLVFLLFAEEQNLLLLGDDVYDRYYAASTLLETLREEADRHGEEVLERRFDAWARLLAIFRAVYSGFNHDRLTMPAYGGSLFNPDRYPFLEGRHEATSWREASAQPLMISNRVVLHLLEALQVLRIRMRDGAPAETRRLSFRALDIEQIGHVYEGLLDHTALRASEPVLGLAGTRDQEPEIALAQLEGLIGVQGSGFRVQGSDPRPPTPEPLIAFLVEHTGRSANALKKAFAAPLDAFRASRLRAACGNDEALFERVLPFAGLIRDDEYGRPVVIPTGSVFVTAGNERRSTGTHYTPRSLTEPIVQYTLEPLVYHGPAEGKPKEEWKLRPAADLLQLTVCDMAMGSGAFLVQACRYLSERLVEAWAAAEAGVQGSGFRGRGVGDVADGVTNLSGTGGVEEGHGSGSGSLSTQSAAAEGGVVRTDQPDAAGRGVDRGEHRGGLRASAPQGIPQPSFDSTRLVDGGRDTSARSGAPGVSGTGAGESSMVPRTGNGPIAQRPDSLAFESTIASDQTSRTPNPEPRTLVTPEGFATTNPNDAIPADPDERTVFARRLIADRCLYGVDKNPLAVEMAKLSLWLITLAKGQPFSFLDHALRCGDSLLGISEIGQLTRWSLARDESGSAQQTSLITRQVEEALEVALRERGKIADLRVRDARDADLKAGWLATAEAALELVRLGADLLIAAALHPAPKMRQSKLTEWLPRYSLLLATAEDTRAGKLSIGGQSPGRAAYAELRREADDLLGGRKPFHWPLEFPEVFEQGSGVRGQGLGEGSGVGGQGSGDTAFATMLASVRSGTLNSEPQTLNPGFAAIIGNPPFMGGQKITGALGTAYRDYLVEQLADGQRGSADICAYFFLRGGTALRREGMAGLLATNTIAQGDTREVGLEQLVAEGMVIPRAVPTRPWPGVAGVEVAHVWLRNGRWEGSYMLDERPGIGITPFLNIPGSSIGNPYRLKANAGKSSQGSVVLGSGFILESEEAKSLIERDLRNVEVLFPYLNGEDLNSHPKQLPSRWVINFHDWPLDRAMLYKDAMNIVQTKVRPEREKVSFSKNAREQWWLYERSRNELYEAIKNMQEVIVCSQTTKHLGFVRVRTDCVFTTKVVIFISHPKSSFPILQSSFHDMWSWQYAATMRNAGISYAISDCFETFPFPWKAQPEPEPRTLNPDPLDQLGERYHTHRQSIMLTRQEGLTKTYNRFHNPNEASADIAELRRLHVEMDNAVAAAYGWADLDLGHGFHDTKQGLRYTISEAARRTVLDRLLQLNHERYAEEVAAGLHEKKGSGARGQGSGKQGRKGKQASHAAPRTPNPEPDIEQGELF